MTPAVCRAKDVDGSYVCPAPRFSLGFFGPVLDLPLEAV
jgi:hypothetical protein